MTDYMIVYMITYGFCIKYHQICISLTTFIQLISNFSIHQLGLVQSILRFEIILQIYLMSERFSDIITTADKEFLAFFTPSFVKKTAVDQPRDPRKVNICCASWCEMVGFIVIHCNCRKLTICRSYRLVRQEQCQPLGWFRPARGRSDPGRDPWTWRTG